MGVRALRSKQTQAVGRRMVGLGRVRGAAG